MEEQVSWDVEGRSGAYKVPFKGFSGLFAVKLDILRIETSGLDEIFIGWNLVHQA